MVIITGASAYSFDNASISSQHRSTSAPFSAPAEAANLAEPATAVTTGPVSLLDGESLRAFLEKSREIWAEWDARELWAKIEVNGEVVARIYRSGGCSIDGDWPVPADFAWDREGIELAKRRAYQLAKAYGGTINGVDPDQAKRSWLDISELESAIGNEADEAQSPNVQLAVPTEAITPSLTTETALSAPILFRSSPPRRPS